MTNSDFQAAMEQAQKYQEFIAKCKEMGDFDNSQILSQNWVTKTEISVLEFVKAYEELFGIYKRFNQRREAEVLLNDLLNFADSCDDFSYLVGLRLLLVMDDKIEWLENIHTNLRQEISQRLEKLIGLVIFNHFEPSFWIIAAKRNTESSNRSALELLRDLANSDDAKAKIDRQLCAVIELAARFNTAYRNLPMAEQWLRWAAEVAQDRLGDKNLSGQFLEGASQIQKAYSQQPPSEAYIRATTSEVNTPEHAAAMHELSLVENLTITAQKALSRQHKDRFLPPLDQLIEEYQKASNGLVKLINDKRFQLNMAQINTKTNQFKSDGLAGWFPAVDIDARDNIREQMSPEETIKYRFTRQALSEIFEAVVNIVHSGIKSGTFSTEAIVTHTSSSPLAYDWTIFKVGVERYVSKDFVSASHILVTQFENIFREVIRANGLPVKRNIGGTTGDLPLNILIEDDKVKNLIGIDLAETIDWYMTKSYGPFSYRHKIAHGWIHPSECDFPLCSLSIWLILKALSYTGS